MSNEKRRIWTAGRRIVGNLIPAFFCLPLFVAGIVVFFDSQAKNLGPSLGLIFGGVAIGWVALNLFGLFGNGEMRQALARQYGREVGRPTGHLVFVGVARPSYRNIWDPHEDIAFLSICADHLEFYGEQLRLDMPRGTITGFRFARNMHSWLLLGRWIVVEGTHSNNPFALYLEPRQHSTLLGNRAYSKALMAELVAWKQGIPGAEAAGDSQVTRS